MDVRASDSERDATVDRLRAAAAEGRITLEELADRVATASSAVMRSDLTTLTADLPLGTALTPPAPAANVRTLGDVKRAGTWIVPAESSFRTFFGTVKLDLRQAQLSALETTIHVRALFGNVELLVPEGVEVEVRAGTRMGRLTLEAGAATPGAPRIVLTGGTVFGDVKVRHQGMLEKVFGRLLKP
jgi:hypothetical protein